MFHSMLFPIFISIIIISLSKGELINVRFIQNPRNFFDGDYKTFSKNFAREQMFGFNEEKHARFHMNLLVI